MRDDEARTARETVIRVVRSDDPVAAVTEEDAARRARTYPNLRLGGPLFGHAEDLGDGGWRISSLEEHTPQAARDSLAYRFRERLLEDVDPAEAEELTAAGQILDWEKVDELSVAGRHYRIIRADTFAAFGADGPEPPRPTDPDPKGPGAAREAPRGSEGLVVNPRVPTGVAHGLLKVNLLPSHYAKASVPPDVYADSRRAVRTHPDGVFLPTEYAVAEYVDGHWQPDTRAVGSPQAARDLITFNFRYLIPKIGSPTEAEAAAYAKAADDLDASRANEVCVLNRRFRVTRIVILLRFGPDGPEPPRPSDYDPDPPPEAHSAQLREEGLLPDPD
ncbi:hypothetical protein BDK92_5221 [Micromonospora pisi]|uniref:Uncharacterized protein n=1 Tax=Micromonospora pisi TaxID=589240 RepID=A0A495JPA9_9ACTN|nr:DUF5954 family protein [Micromonospora pisi]RKR90837.1 hypothetical protein BDK92_5221 [Micromonospora pisi]